MPLYTSFTNFADVLVQIANKMGLQKNYLILPAALGPEVNSASNRNEYQTRKYNIVSGQESAAGA
jgi:hypothetical protein